MKLIPQITFRGFPHSDAVEKDVLDKIAGLESIFDKITSCRVVLESPHHRHHKGYTYRVRVDVRVPGAELVVNRDPYKNQAHQDIYVAIRDAFESIKRQLKKYSRIRHREVKLHENATLGHVTTVFQDRGYGFITTTDGREIYFHKNSLNNSDFNKLRSGKRVHYVEEQGDKGPQATFVQVLR